MKLDTNNRSVFLLHYHLVLVVKYRRNVINDDISNELKVIFENIQGNYDVNLQEWNHDVDHVHVLFKANPKTDLTKFLNSYKSASSRIIKRKFQIGRAHV